MVKRSRIRTRVGGKVVAYLARCEHRHVGWRVGSHTTQLMLSPASGGSFVAGLLLAFAELKPRWSRDEN